MARGGVALAILTNGSGDNLISQFAIGQTLTDHDVRFFGDFTYYLSTVVNTPLANGNQTSVMTLTPGLAVPTWVITGIFWPACRRR